MAFEVRDDLPVYTIGRVTELTGLTARQVRYYENKKLVTPARTEGHQRLYSRDQLVLLQMVKRLLDEGYTLSNIVALVHEYNQQRSPEMDDYPSRESIGRHEKAASLYPLVNRARLLTILDRLERRDAERASRGDGEE